jgi:hypothetical protein
MLVIKDVEILISSPVVSVSLQNALKGTTKELVFKLQYENYKVAVSLPNIVEN